MFKLQIFIVRKTNYEWFRAYTCFLVCSSYPLHSRHSNDVTNFQYRTEKSNIFSIITRNIYLR